MEIVKAEMLWSRICPLNCEYCGMVDGRRNVVPVTLWLEGIDNLKKLGCGFIAFYGAEPLEEFDFLPPVIRHAEEIGIHTTVITSGATSNFYRKLDRLYDYGGLRSLTMSYDVVPLGNSSSIKMKKAIEALKYFQNKGYTRDVAAVATLTATNFRLYPDMVKQMTALGIWSFFDLIHSDRGQPGTKCKNFPGIKNLLFSKEDMPDLIKMLTTLGEMKREGYLIHSSHIFLEKVLSKETMEYDWNCANENVFPSWVSVDVSGTVYPCDDFQPKDVLNTKVWNLYNEWDVFCKVWKPIVLSKCNPCLWNTHIDAHAIKEGSLSFGDYVHIREGGKS